jgi:hypothetical protein
MKYLNNKPGEKSRVWRIIQQVWSAFEALLLRASLAWLPQIWALQLAYVWVRSFWVLLPRRVRLLQAIS